MFPDAIMAAGCYGGVAGAVGLSTTCCVLVGEGDTAGVDSVSYTIGANAWPTGVGGGGPGGVSGSVGIMGIVGVASTNLPASVGCSPVALIVTSKSATTATIKHMDAVLTSLVMAQSSPYQVSAEVPASVGIQYKENRPSPRAQTRDVRSRTRFV